VAIVDVPNTVNQGRLESLLPKLHPWIELRELGNNQFVVKNQKDSSYFSCGPQEFYLLKMLQQDISLAELTREYHSHFGETLEKNELGEFLFSIQNKKLIPLQDIPLPGGNAHRTEEDETDDELAPANRTLLNQSIFFWRLPLLNPDKFLSLLVSLIPGVWSYSFCVSSLLFIALAALVLIQSGTEIQYSLMQSLRWETLVVVGIASFSATLLHETAHGATCKRFGGEVREAGILFLMLIPCLYVNVTDAWTIPSKHKRMLITAAGAFMDLIIWSICVFIWRITVQDSLINYLAFIVMSTCGTRCLLNLNPLLRFDGYYLLCDWLSIPNLFIRSRDYWFQHLAWILWGAARPKPIEHKRLVLAYGIINWIFAIAFLNFVLIGILSYLSLKFGYAGLIFGGLLMLYAVRRVFKGFLGKEFLAMIRTRTTRSLVWGFSILAVVALLFSIPTRHNVHGDFEVRPLDCIDVPAPLGSFIESVNVADGQSVSIGDVICELHSPELKSQIETKQAELLESEAIVKRLKAGTRREELAEQEARVTRLTRWLELGKIEVETMKSSLNHQLNAVGHRVKQAEAECNHAKKVLKQSEQLAEQGALAPAQLDRERTKCEILSKRLEELQAEKARIETEGIRSAIAELSRREQELADAESNLRLLKLGSRPEDIQAEEARFKRLTEELDFLTQQNTALKVLATKNGQIRAARLKEKIGAYVAKGDLLCQIEAAGSPLIEVLINEQDALAITPGQKVTFKARALPLDILEGRVERIATAANAIPTPDNVAVNKPSGQNVILYCKIEKGVGQLKSGMTGFARVSRGWSTLGHILHLQGYRYLRTEFWW
jgi:putative peptide zinc metalloprotease protein